MKKTNKLIALLIVIAMITAFCAVSAFALSEDTATAADEGASYLVKYLKIKEGITIPSGEFEFIFEAYEADETDDPANSATVKVSEVPGIDSRRISISALTPSNSEDDDGALVGTISIEDILEDVDFPHAGEYIYKVTETNPANPGLMIYSDQVYYLHVYVKNGENGSTEISGVTVEEEKDLAEGENDPTYEKKDITDPDPSDGSDNQPGGGDDKTQDEITEAEVEGFTFVNEYDKENTRNKDGAFVVSKAVAGDYADKTYEFPFTISITKPEGYNGQTAIKAYVMKATDANAEYATKGTVNTVNIGGNATFELADGYKLVIPELPNEATVNVTETLNTATALEQLNTYTASYKVTDNGAEDSTATQGEAGEALAARAVTVNDNDDGANIAAYTNTSSYEPTPTGILMNNLPYIILVLVVLGGLTGYVVSKRRREQE